MKTVVCMAMTNASMFSWLGSKPVAAWTMEKLSKVRGVDLSVCVAPKEFMDSTGVVLPYADGADAVLLPESVDRSIDAVPLANWLCTHGPAAKATYLAIVKPSFPFLPYQRIEECLEMVRSGGYDAAVTTRQCRVFDPAGQKRMASPSALFLDAVVVVRAKLMRDAPAWPRKTAQVEVSFTEGMCVEGELYVGGGDPLVVAQAMADNGAC